MSWYNNSVAFHSKMFNEWLRSNNHEVSRYTVSVSQLCFRTATHGPTELQKPRFACALEIRCLVKLLIFGPPYIHQSRHGLHIDLSNGMLSPMIFSLDVKKSTNRARVSKQGQKSGASMLSLLLSWISCWTSSRFTGFLRRSLGHVISLLFCRILIGPFSHAVKWHTIRLSRQALLWYIEMFYAVMPGICWHSIALFSKAAT